jgi:amino acid adenylation domain-containing protein/non-ribosomal peptide synthase protein (TIGR01720 family)
VLRRVRQTVLGAYSHQDVPFEKLVEELAPERDLSHSPLFQVMLTLQNTPQEDVHLDSLRIAPVASGDAPSKFDLTLSVTEEGQGLVGALTFRADLYERVLGERLLGHFTAVMEAMVERPDQSIYAWPWLDRTQRKRVIHEWNQTVKAFPAGLVHERVAAHAASSPNSLAVIYEGERLTYAELDRRASTLAGYLRQHGVGPEVKVGILMERSLPLVGAILGIWKAGGAYLPLDPAFPQERLAYMLADCGAGLVLTSRELVSKVPPGHCPVVAMDDGWETAGAGECAAVSPRNLAYVIYTSGSTGRPKGVAVEHGSLANYVAAVSERIGFAKDAAYAWMSSVAADLGNTTLFGGLAAGGCVHVIGEERAHDSQAFEPYFANAGIDIVKVTPTHWSALSTGGMPGRRLILGGESSRWEQVSEWQRLRPGCEVWNHYGPTECTVGVAAFQAASEGEAAGVLPLGKPLANLRAYVLDVRGEPVPAGIAGELYIGGACVARGYLNQPGLTAERFVPDPFAAEPGARMYRSGDKARWRADGNLEFLGRLDEQVKIRGHRIELREIEAALTEVPGIQQCAVIAREDANGDKRLTAYVVPGGEAPDSPQLKQKLRGFLPGYMVPSKIVFLDRLPLLPNGKLDRRALPVEPTAGGEEFDEPRTAMEAELAQIWKEVLGSERIGIDQNFFDLGGDSFLAIRMVALAGQRGIQITVRQLFQYQCVRSLAAVAVPKCETDEATVAGPIPLSPIQRALMEESPRPELYHQSLVFDSSRQLDERALEQASKAMVAQHDALRVRFARGGAILENSHQNVFVHADFSTLPRSLREAAARRTTHELQSFDLAAGPLMRIAMFSGIEPAAAARLLVTTHHMAIDAVSWRILIEDLETAYLEAEHGDPIHLPAKTSSWRKWVETLAEYSRSEQLKSELGYWSSAERGAVEPLPRDFPPTASGLGERRSLSVDFDPDATQWLLNGLPRCFDVEIQDAILAALLEAFHHWTGRDECFLNMRGHGREEIAPGVDVSRTLGWFTSIIPVLLRREKGGMRDRLSSVRRQLRSIPSRGIGYGVLRYLSADQEIASELRRMPDAEIGFNYLGRLDHPKNKEQVLKLSSQSEGEVVGDHGILIPLVGIAAAILDDQLRVTWFYRSRTHEKSTIDSLARRFRRSLLRIVEESRQSPSALLAANAKFL